MYREVTLNWMLFILPVLAMWGSLGAQEPIAPAVPVEPAPAPLAAPGDGFVPGPPMAPPTESTTGRRVGVKNRIRLTMDDGSQLIGEIVGATKLQIKATYGELDLPWKDVGLVERDFEEEKVRVTMSNGDRITGEISLGDLKFKTGWGEVEIAKDHLQTMELGTLHEDRAPVTRLSPDGRTRVTVYRTRRWFQPQIGPSGNTNVPPVSHPPSVYSIPSYPVPADSAPTFPEPRPFAH